MIEIGTIVMHRGPSMEGPLYVTDTPAKVVDVLEGGVVNLLRRNHEGDFRLPAYGQQQITADNPYGYLSFGNGGGRVG